MKFSQDFSQFYDDMNYLRQSWKFQFEENPFNINAQGTAEVMHEIS